jgi:hypothetical protein
MMLLGWTNGTTDPISKTTSLRNTGSEQYLKSSSTRYVLPFLGEDGELTKPVLLQEFIGGNSDLQALKGPALEKKLAAPKKA